MSDKRKVSFLGLGVMGGAIARHIGNAGHDLTIYNRSPERLAAWQQAHPGLEGRVAANPADADAGSIIVVVATDAPLLPHQCARLAQRAGLGIARMGGTGGHTSGDLFICFATGNRDLPQPELGTDARTTVELRMLSDSFIDPLFLATIEATEEAIVNALVAAETMTGIDGVTAHRLPHDRVRAILRV